MADAWHMCGPVVCDLQVADGVNCRLANHRSNAGARQEVHACSYHPGAPPHPNDQGFVVATHPLDLTGTLPYRMSELKELRRLELGSNLLTGSLPVEFSVSWLPAQ